MFLFEEEKKPLRIIACGVFRHALNHLCLTKRIPDLSLTFLSPSLHLKPQELQNRLSKEILAARKRKERILCLYGVCLPDMEEFCKQQGVVKVPGLNCYEILLGTEKFRALVEETAGTLFVERELLVNFREHFVEPLELYDEEMRTCFFKHYDRLLYVRQPSDPDLAFQARDLADFLELSLEIRDADYSHLERILQELIPNFPNPP